MNNPNAVKASRSKAVVTGPPDGASRSKAVVTGPSDGDRQPIGISPSAKYQCGQCGEHQYKSHIYINLEDPRMDLQGARNLICCKCWNENQKGNCKKWNQVDWLKSCDDQWLQRASTKLRNFKKRKQSRIWYNRRIAERRKREICMRSLEVFPRWMRERAREQFNVELYKEDEAMSVDDSIQTVQEHDYFTAMDRDDTTATLTDHFVEKVVTGADVCFICRQKHCSMVSLSTHWVHNQPNGNHRCPACGEQYRPWKLQPGYWTANKVFIYYDAVCLQEDRAELAAGSSDGPADNDQVMVFPVHWPDYSPQSGVHYNVKRAQRNVQRATCNSHCATCIMRRSTCTVQRATCNVQCATYDVQRATCSM
jgi:hypothetical protein